MRLLIIGLNFSPELTGIGKYTGELAAYLSGKSHQIRVITAPPYYPHWKVQGDYSWWKYCTEDWQGIRVYRTPLWVPREPSGWKRVLHLLSFSVSGFPVALAQVFWGPELVLCIAPSFLSAPLSWIVARLCRAKAWLHLQDFELEAATRLGLLPGGRRLTQAALRFERWMLLRFDVVSTISERMLSRLREKGVDPAHLRLFPNWVDLETIFPKARREKNLRQQFSIPLRKAVVLYAGNMGHKQGLEIVVGVARELAPCTGIHFVMCGEGASRGVLERAAEGLPNVQFLDLQPPERLNDLLNVADIHLLPQKAKATDLVMPSKLSAMLASGRAVVAVADPESELAGIVSQVGRIIPPSELGSLRRAILDLVNSPDLRAEYGRKGRRYACRHWDASLLLSRFEEQLNELADA